MPRKLAKDTEIRTHVVPCFHDWDIRSVWKLMKPSLEGDQVSFRKPDGEPTHWDIILVRGNKDYERSCTGECNCDLSQGEMCPHWREIRETK